MATRSLFTYTDQTVPKRILLRSKGGQAEELPAGDSIIPGQLVQINPTGVLVVHGTVGGYAEKAFAVEDALQARTLDDAYLVADPVQYYIAQPGDIIFSFLEDGDSVNPGDLLASNGAGDLRKVQGSDKPVAVSLDKLDLSHSANNAHGRIRARII